MTPNTQDIASESERQQWQLSRELGIHHGLVQCIDQIGRRREQYYNLIISWYSSNFVLPCLLYKNIINPEPLG